MTTLFTGATWMVVSRVAGQIVSTNPTVATAADCMGN